MEMHREMPRLSSFGVKDLLVRIGRKEILSHLSMEFSVGKRTAIIGANGAGKSTLLRALARLNDNYQGEILLDGEDTKRLSRKQLARRLAILPQGMQAPADTTVETLVDYGRFPYRSWHGGSQNAREDRMTVEWALSVTRLKALKDRQVMTLSGGERQRAWIAMALAQKPEILLLDEPTTYLDIAHQLEVMQLVQNINEEYGMTVIMVLHDINHALQYADEIAVIKDGGIFSQGRPEAVLNVDMLREVFGVRADIFRNSQGAAVLSPVEIVGRA